MRCCEFLTSRQDREDAGLELRPHAVFSPAVEGAVVASGTWDVRCDAPKPLIDGHGCQVALLEGVVEPPLEDDVRRIRLQFAGNLGCLILGHAVDKLLSSVAHRSNYTKMTKSNSVRYEAVLHNGGTGSDSITTTDTSKRH